MYLYIRLNMIFQIRPVPARQSCLVSFRLRNIAINITIIPAKVDALIKKTPPCRESVWTNYVYLSKVVQKLDVYVWSFILMVDFPSAGGSQD